MKSKVVFSIFIQPPTTVHQGKSKTFEFLMILDCLLNHISMSDLPKIAWGGGPKSHFVKTHL